MFDLVDLQSTRLPSQVDHGVCAVQGRSPTAESLGVPVHVIPAVMVGPGPAADDGHDVAGCEQSLSETTTEETRAADEYDLQPDARHRTKLSGPPHTVRRPTAR